MHKVVAARHIDGYVLEVQFEDGKRKRIDFEEYLTGEVFEPLRDIEQFKSFTLDKELGTIVWDTGADFCPDFLHSHAREVCEVEQR